MRYAQEQNDKRVWRAGRMTPLRDAFLEKRPPRWRT